MPPLTISLPLLETKVTFIFKTETDPLRQTVSATRSANHLKDYMQDPIEV